MQCLPVHSRDPVGTGSAASAAGPFAECCGRGSPTLAGTQEEVAGSVPFAEPGGQVGVLGSAMPSAPEIFPCSLRLCSQEFLQVAAAVVEVQASPVSCCYCFFFLQWPELLH